MLVRALAKFEMAVPVVFTACIASTNLICYLFVGNVQKP